jgi:hypothetical protein
MNVLRWVLLVLALPSGGWMLFDGVRALTVGDYVTAKTGPHAGRLGPWASLLRAVGIEPRSTPVKLAFVLLGAAWLVAAAAVALRQPWGRPMLFVCAGIGLAYAPVGTVIGVVQIGLLLWVRGP